MTRMMKMILESHLKSQGEQSLKEKWSGEKKHLGTAIFWMC